MKRGFCFLAVVAHFVVGGPCPGGAALAGYQWNIQTVDSDGDVGGWTSLALDRAGNPQISYSGNGALRYAFIPEPASICLAGLGGLTLLGKRKGQQPGRV